MDKDSSDSAVRQNLLDRLLHAVKQVQVHFGARQEIATETDVRVSTLCTEWEAVLLHGQRKPKPKSSLRITPPPRGGGGGLVTLWPLARLALSHEEQQRFLQLEHTTSEIGRGRAWLRAAINERTLENYLHTILGSEETLRSLYMDNAFVLDQERSSMLPVMAAGLSSIIFSIPIDADYLNTTSRSVDVPPEATPPLLVNHTPILVDRMAGNNDDPGDDDEVIAINAKDRKKKKKKSRSQHSPIESTEASPLTFASETTPPMTVEDVIEEDTQPLAEVGVVNSGGMDTLSIAESISSSSSRLSVNDEGNPPMFVALGTDVMSHDLINSEAEAAVNATALVLSATTGQPVESVKCEGVEGVRSGGGHMTAEELREAVLVLVKAKEELETTNSRLRSQIADLESTRAQLLSDCETSTNEIQLLRDSHATQLQGLERENDLLREQLKKYVGMVQSRRREESEQSTDSLVPSLSESTEGQAAQDQKLVEMAEMYAELMELNERLHKTVAGRDTVISTLVSSMRQAGLEIPVAMNKLPAAVLQPKSLVDVWIPSAIKKGRGPDTHHVYQVFIRVRSEEWNVYRRYAEFREFHLQLSKHLPQVTALSFPPRKTRNKSSQVVEERRQRLQDYLRQVVHICTTTPSSVVRRRSQNKVADSSPILQADVTKATLVHLFPFFREDLYIDSQRPTTPSYSGL